VVGDLVEPGVLWSLALGLRGGYSGSVDRERRAGGEAFGLVQVERGAGPRRGPASGQCQRDISGDVPWQNHSTGHPEPVAGMRLTRGDDQGRARGVGVLHRVRTRSITESLVVRGPAAQAPAVSRAIDDDASRTLAADCHGAPPSPGLAAMLAGQTLGKPRISGRLWAVRGGSGATDGDR
jgi:hypothetical protein